MNRFKLIIKEWNIVRNGGLNPANFTYGSKTKVWWICEEGHEWIASINNRVCRESNCPICKKGYIKEGNSLEENFPFIAKQWHPTKNGLLKPSEIGYMSRRLIWWQCTKGHEWQQIVQARTVTNIVCNLCLLFENSIGTKYPELSKEWDYNKNESSPFETLCHSKINVYWICKNGHSLFLSPSYRIKGYKCKYCIGKGATEIYNFGIKYPELLEQWDYDKNDFTPYNLIPGSNKLVNWVCNEGHTWMRKINSIIRNETNECPTCYIKNKNLEKLYPEIADEWDYSKNGDLSPSDITYASTLCVWWKCKKGHKWNVQISSRTSNNSSCPDCANTGFSKIALKWLHSISLKENINIQHIKNGGEYKIEIDGKKFRVDGYCKETNTVYEFLGCLWHFHLMTDCCINKKKGFFDRNPINKKLNIDLYLYTIERLNKIKNKGYNLITIWECKYLKSIKDS